jgi:anti-sigma-K factor RskA
MSAEESRMHSGDCGGDTNAAPYVLGALTEAERIAFMRHLESCAVCREEVASLRIAADLLASAVPHVPAPAHLRQRVMLSAREDPRRSDSSASTRVRRLPASGRLGWRPAVALVVVAAVAVALVVVALVSGDGTSATRLIRAEVLAPRASASVRLRGAHAELNIVGMPQTPPSRVYEVWIKRSGAPQPTDALFTVTAKGDATVGVPGSVSGVKAILVTSEPLGGSPAPTRKPVIVAPLS